MVPLLPPIPARSEATKSKACGKIAAKQDLQYDAVSREERTGRASHANCSAVVPYSQAACATTRLNVTEDSASGLVCDVAMFNQEDLGTVSLPPPPSVAATGGSGAVICFGGLQRGFVGSDYIPQCHASSLLRPLAAVFDAGQVEIAFSLAARDPPIPTRILRLFTDALQRNSRMSNYGTRANVSIVQERRPAHIENLTRLGVQLGGVEHCGHLIARREADRRMPFAFAIRMRYDLLLSPRLALERWPIWNRRHPTAPAVLALAKYCLDNTCPFSCPGGWLTGRSPVMRCVPQDVFFVVARTPHLGPVHALLAPANRSLHFTTHGSHKPKRFTNRGLHWIGHAAEATLFWPAVQARQPIYVLWHRKEPCTWLLAGPRTLFKRRCVALRKWAESNRGFQHGALCRAFELRLEIAVKHGIAWTCHVCQSSGPSRITHKERECALRCLEVVGGGTARHARRAVARVRARPRPARAQCGRRASSFIPDRTRPGANL